MDIKDIAYVVSYGHYSDYRIEGIFTDLRLAKLFKDSIPDSNKIIELPQYMKRASGTAKMQVSGGWAVGPLWRKFVDRMYEKIPSRIRIYKRI